MPAPRRSPNTELFSSLCKDSSAAGENRDCSVKAVAAVCNVSYAQAHAALSAAGRKEGQGASTQQIRNALVRLRHGACDVPQETFLRQYTGGHAKLQSLTTHHPQRFPRVWKNGKRYLAFVRGHVAAIVDGETHDWTASRAMRITKLLEIWERQ